jgi:hypothetical protein
LTVFKTAARTQKAINFDRRKANKNGASFRDVEGYQTFTKRFRVREPPIFLTCLVIVREKIGVGKKVVILKKKSANIISER